MKKNLSVINYILILGLTFLIASCQPGPENSVEELVIGVSQDYRATDVFSHKGFNCLVFQTLIKIDAQGSFQPLLAESWEISPDARAYTFHLRKGICFSDGTALTAEQVRESMLYKETKKRKRGPSRGEGKRPGSRPVPEGAKPDDDGEKLNREYSTFDNRRYNLPNWYAFQSIDVIDEHTIRFNLSRPYTLFLNELSSTHSYPVMKADPDEEVTGYIGTGPYKIDEMKRTQYLTLTKNEHFWQGDVRIDKIRLKVIPDAETRAMSLEAGEIHLTGYDHFDKLPNESVPRLKETPGINVLRLGSADQPTISYMMINYKNPVFTDANVRKALALAIDRTSIDKIMPQTGRTLTSLFPEDYALYNPDTVKHSYNPELAKQLLGQAGLADNDGDSILDRNGEPFTITLYFNSFDPQYKTIAEIVQANLRDIGIIVKLRMMELGAHITVMRNAEYDMAIWPMMRYHMFFYTAHPSWLNVYNSPELDDAFTGYLHTDNPDESVEAVNLTQKLIMESHVFPLFFERFDVVAWNREVLQNFEPQPIGWDLSMTLWQANLKK